MGHTVLYDLMGCKLVTGQSMVGAYRYRICWYSALCGLCAGSRNLGESIGVAWMAAGWSVTAISQYIPGSWCLAQPSPFPAGFLVPLEGCRTSLFSEAMYIRVSRAPPTTHVVKLCILRL